MYTINELMKLRNIECMQPAKLFDTPIVGEILRQDLDQMPTYMACPKFDFSSKPNDSIQNRLRQFQHQRNRHHVRSTEDLNSRNGSHQQKRHNRHNGHSHTEGALTYYLKFVRDI